MVSSAVSPQARREVIQAEALAWLSANPAEPTDGVITSLPDVSELPGYSLESWKDWFVTASRRVIDWVSADAVSMFYQSDIRRGVEWVDKAYLVQRAVELQGAILLWHKIVCRHPAGSISVGRPSYSHLLCVAKQRHRLPLRPGPDVLPSAGYMPWSRAMGVQACRVACQFLLDETSCRRVVDPFCGRGTVLAVANAMGMDALGIELGGKRCRMARNLVLEP